MGKNNNIYQKKFGSYNEYIIKQKNKFNQINHVTFDAGEKIV